MGTIPAPNIAQDAMQIAQAPVNSLAEYADVAKSRAQTAMLGQQAQGEAQQNQIRAQQLKDQDALTKTIAQYDPNKNSIADIPKMMTSNGGSGQAALNAQQGLIQQRQNYLKMSDEQFAAEQHKNDLIQGVHDAVTNAAPEQKQQIYQQGLQQLAHAGVDVSNEPTQYPGDDVFAQHLPAIRLHSAILAESEKDRQLTTSEQEAQTKQQEANAKDWKDFPELGVSLNTRTGEQRSVSGGAMMTPSMMENKYVQLAGKKAAGQPIADEDANWMKGYEKYKTLVPVANFNLQNSGAAADQNGNPSQIAQAIAENRMKWSEAVSPRTPQSVKNAIMAQVFKLNPNYDTSEFGLESDAAKKARSGAWADTRLAYNTALDHSSQLLDTIDALNNGDTQKLNSLKNFFKTQFGSPDVPSYQAVANAYNHEVTSVLAKGHLTDAEIAQGGSTLPSNASPQAARKAVSDFQQLMQSKRDELDKIIRAGAGNKANGILSDQANSGGNSAATKTYQGHTYTQQSDGSWKLTK